MLIGDGPRREQPAHPTATAPAPVRLSFLLLVMPALISAAPLSDVDDLVRQGNDAFRRQDYEAAIMLYEQAQTHAVDPGLVAFNKGAALFRLERHAEAAAHWQRCLEDGAIPPERKARAAYDLGTTLLHQGGDKSRRLLERAVTAFRQCLDANPDGELRADALHNLELARWLWLKAKANGADEPPDTPDSNDHRPQSRFNGEEPQGRNGLAPGHDNGGDKMGGDDGPFGEQKKLAQGPLLVLPDQEELVPLPPDETRAALDRLAARIAAEARAYRQQAPPARPEVKDW
jgi:tetratricopeptide (TPR) repeat protein